MFNGIIKNIGVVNKIDRRSGNLLITIGLNKIINDLYIGSSISINGACQTIVDIESKSFKVEAVQETLNLTTFKFLKPQEKVNLELPAKFGDDISGHLVTGHIDGVGKITKIAKERGSNIYSIEVNKSLSKYIAPKGSIAVDGVSLTISEICKNFFKVVIIPHTSCNTVLYDRKIRDLVNIETDILAKYVNNTENIDNNSNITLQMLSKNGFI